MRYTLLYIAILISLQLSGQISLRNDTIKISEVIISGKKITREPAGFKSITIDTSVLRNYSHGTLAEILAVNSGIFIKSYGMGSVATPSFRGTGASHTQLAWNGINLNHPMLGQADLSLIPAGLIDDIHIYFGAASMVHNSGGIGGLINLESKSDWKDETIISINPGYGSFGHYTGLLKIKSGNDHFQSVTKAYLSSSENNFRYLNTEISSDPVWERRKNSQFFQQGYIQELYYRNKQNLASAKIWYQSAERNLPGSMLTQSNNSGEKQYDEALRALFNYDFSPNATDYFVTGALTHSRLNYANRLAGINSKNQSETLILKSGLEKTAAGNIKYKVVLQEELNVVKTTNYNGNALRNTASLSASAENSRSNRLGFSILVRETLDKNTFLIPDFSAGLQFRILKNSDHLLKANISRNTKIPTMNDLFWVPGGNKELKNEYAFMYELAYGMSANISSHLSVSYDLSLFRNSIMDMIQWSPGDYSYWTAANIKSVVSEGLESDMSLAYTGNNYSSSLSAGYSYTSASSKGSAGTYDSSVGKQLIYIPMHQANISCRFSSIHFYSTWGINMTGKRYTTVDNSKYLPGYILNNLSIGDKVNLKSFLLDLNFKIDNLFNVTYQTVAHYPLPGRYYSINLLIQKQITR